ncbi:MAG: hypothetical protein RG741_05520 [Bacteroidales bacterium]|nr:hypothetical protein [Bacteroidales bacterium]
MKTIAVLFLLILVKTCTVCAGHFSDSDLPVSIRGYVKAMPGVRFDNSFSKADINNTFHNRINLRWDIAPGLNLRLEGRNRLIYNDMFIDLEPGFFDLLPGIDDVKDFYTQDDGLVNMSWVWLSGEGWIGHTEIDRFFLDWSHESWRIRVGRQRINWGINLVSNPNDLFNTYSFFDVDYPERPGADAVRVQHYLSGMSNLELAVSPARNSRDMVAAARFVHNWRAYDLQLVTGYYKNRLALGGGWAGHIGGAGFKGEATWFHDLEKQEGITRGTVVAAAGLDYMFPQGTFVILEALYNGGHERLGQFAFSINEPLSPDNIMFSKYAITLSADRAFSPLFSGGLAMMALPDIEAAFIMPNISYSLLTNLDLECVAQFFAGGKNTIFEEAGYGLFAVVKYSF